MRERGPRSGESLRDLVYFPVVFNLFGIAIIGVLYAASPGHLVESDALNTVLYLGVFMTEWSLFYIVVRRLGIAGVRGLFERRRTKWLPSALVFISLNLLFTAYMYIALRSGRIPPWGRLNPFQVFFFLVLNPITAGVIEELIWRGYFIEKLLVAGKTEWSAIVVSSISFAFIHGFIVFEKLAVTFVFGVLAAAYYVRERNLPVLIASHIVVDVIAFGMPFIITA